MNDFLLLGQEDPRLIGKLIELEQREKIS